MHMQTQISGQISGQVPSQTGLHLPTISQQNGNPLLSQMQPGDFQNSSRMGSDLSMARKCVQDRIIQFFLQRNTTPEMQQRIPEIARRLDERLFNDASSIEEYVNIDSLERRLAVLIQRFKKTGQQRQSSSHSSSSVGTMIPTPGMTPIGSGNSTSLALGDNLVKTSNTVVPVTANSVSLSPTANGSNGVQGGSFNGSGSLANDYQQSPVNIPMGPSQTSNIMRSTGAPNVGTQMIPTPGLNNGPSMQMNMECSTSSLAKQYFGNKNGHAMQNIGSPMSMGMGSSPQQNTSTYGFLNESIDGGQPLIENDVHVMNGPRVSEEYLNASQYGDTYKMNGPYSTGSGNLSCSPSTVGSAMNNQNLNPGSLQLTSNANSGMLSHQRSVVVRQPTQMKSITSDQSKKVNLQLAFSKREQVAKSQQQMGKLQEQQFQQSYTHFVQHQHQQPVQYQQHQQPLLRNDILRKSQPSFNVGVKNMADHSMAYRDDGLHSQMSEQYHVSESQEHYTMQSTGNEDYPKGDQMIYNSSEFQDVHASSRSEALRQGQHAQSLENRGEAAAHLSTSDQKFQDEFRQRIGGQDEAQQPHSSVGGSATDQSTALKGGAVREGTTAGELKDVKREQDYKNQQRWLLFLRHARSCSARKGNCQEVTCNKVQELWKHMIQCKVKKCTYPRCSASKALIDHNRQCKAVDCPVCIPVQTYLAMQRSSQFRPTADTALKNSQHGNLEVVDGANVSRIPSKNGLNTIGTSEEYQSSIKRMKVEHSSPQNVHEGKPNLQVHKHIEVPVDEEVMEMKQEQLLANGEPVNSVIAEVKTENLETVRSTKSDMIPSMDNEHSVQIKNEKAVVDREKDQIEVAVKQDPAKAPSDPVAGAKSVKPNIKGVSLTELFTPEQVREHIRGLRQWVGQSKAKVEKNQAIGHLMSENSCQLCGVEKLTFEPPPIYCSTCGSRIKRNAMYYTMGSGDTKHYFCIPCYNEARGDSIDIDGNAISKSRLEKKKNDEETEEGWVQCDKCEAWQHQVCALFNIRRNDGGEAEYTCPNCFILEVERGERKPLPQNAVLGAKDLPRTILSDHIEQRLARKLKQERLERARFQGKNFEEVPGAEALVVRVVLSVDKKLEVKQRFLEIFQEENYPTEFPYKSKVILLFQKIEGVEVCLFGMYVQEFGSECSFPNQRRVYLSYLDSVKYFRPDIRTVSGEALRTFVYQEILIGYLEYCKRRGFTSCYIWACPPLRGEDYILYCHPEIQKTPKSDKLREWYLSMLRKASKENVVVDLTNLYDHFFVSLGECKAKVTAARLPYFDGDYWPGAAEDMINQLRQEEDDGKQQKKGKIKKIITKRALKAAGHTDLSCNASKDALLMQKLGETIFPMKEDFIMVHLQHACTHCCHLMVFGKRWLCGRCKNFQLCDKCYEDEQKREERERHPVNSREKHALSPVGIDDVPADTKDRDEILDSEFFDTRQAFLSLCQGNHYQYDTLRRAKHSSMMVLYHLHNPTAPAFVTTCSICRRDIETGQGWRCEVCPDFDICNACYQRDGGTGHPHTLTSHPSMAERDAQNQEARQQRVLQLRKMLDLLVHASQCRSAQCRYPNCRQVKGLFRHGMQCRTRATGGCVLCKKMWYLLQLHARACKESDCRVPRCKDLKEHMKRLQQQSDSRRRAAVMEMMRQRAAERKMG